MKTTPYIHKTEIRLAFERAGYPIRGKAGLKETSGWTVDRAQKRRRRG